MEKPSTSKDALRGQTELPTDPNMKENVQTSGLYQDLEKNNVSGLSGYDYQIQWLMKILFWTFVKQKEYIYIGLGAEVKAAGSFDDLVFEYTKVENGPTQSLMLQCKHTKNTGSKIDSQHLLASKGDFSLIKYFLSYIKLQESKYFKDKNLMIVTNYIFNTKELEHKNIAIVLRPNAIWDALMGDSKRGNCYKFSSDTGDLILLLEKKMREILVEEVIDKYLYNKVMSHETGIFKFFHVFLANNVFEIETRKFKSPLGEFGQQILVGIVKKTDKLITRENVHDNVEFKGKKTGFQFSPAFGEGEDADLIGRLREFLDRLTFAIDQPNVEELPAMMKDELRQQFLRDEKTTEDNYLSLESKVKCFYKNQKQAFLLFKEADGIICSIKHSPILFKLSPVQESFTGRIDELKKIHEALKRAKTAISGMGGIGKTELARKFAHEYKKEYDFIVWIDAENSSSLEASFRELAQVLKISLTDQDKAEKKISAIVGEVHRYFDEHNCLFIYDNAINLNSHDEGIQRFLPTTSSDSFLRHILITSQNCKWGGFEVIQIEELTETDAIKFVEQELKLSVKEDPDTIELTKKLQCFPLALQQATAYIRSTQEAAKNVNLQFTIKDYLELFENTQYPEELLDYKFSEDSSNTYTKTTLTTWKMAVDRIKADKDCGSLAIEILKICACLDPNNIPTGMFIHLSDEKLKVGRAIELLKKYSLVTFRETLFWHRDRKVATISVHRLVQFYVRSNWKNQELMTMVEAGRLVTSSINNENLCKDFDYEYYLENFIVLLQQYLEKSAEACQKLKENDLFFNFALEIIKMKKLINTYWCVEIPMKWIKKIYNDSDIISVAIALREAGAKSSPNQYKYLKECIEIFKKHDSTRNVADGLVGLSSIYDNCFRWSWHFHYLEKSLKLKTQALNILKNRDAFQLLVVEFSKTYEQFRSTLVDIIPSLKLNETELYFISASGFEMLDNFIESQIYFKLIRPPEYENLLKRYVPKFEVQYGSEDGRTADLLFDLGTIKSVTDVTFLERALRIYLSQYGAEHFKVIRAYKALSLKYVVLENWEKAHEFQVKAWEASDQNQAECFEILQELKKVSLDLKSIIDFETKLYDNGNDYELDLFKEYFELNIALEKFIVGPKELNKLQKELQNYSASSKVCIKECGYRHKIVFAALYAFKIVSENAINSDNENGENVNLTKCKGLLERALNVYKKRYGLEIAPPVNIEVNAGDGDPFRELNKRFCDLKRWQNALKYSLGFRDCNFISNIDQFNPLTQFAKMAELGFIKSDQALNEHQQKTFDDIKKISVEEELELKESLKSFEQLYRPDEINLHIQDSEVCLKLLAWLHYKRMNDEFFYVGSDEIASSVNAAVSGGDSVVNKRLRDLTKWHNACKYSIKFSQCFYEINSLSQFAKLAKCTELKINPQYCEKRRLLEIMQQVTLDEIKKIVVEDEHQLTERLDNFQGLYKPNEIDYFSYSSSFLIFGMRFKVSRHVSKLLAWLHYQKMNDDFLYIDSEINKFLSKQDPPRTFDSNELCSSEGRFMNIFANVNPKQRLSFERYDFMDDLSVLIYRVFKIDPPTFCWEHNLKLKAIYSFCIASEALEEYREQLECEKVENTQKKQKYHEIEEDFTNMKHLLKLALLQSENLKPLSLD